MKLQTLRAINAMVRREAEAWKELGGTKTSAAFGTLIGYITAEICCMLDNPNKVFLPGIVHAVRNDLNKLLETNF